MTRTDVMASSRPHTAGVGRAHREVLGSGRRATVLVLALLTTLALALPSASLATTTGTSGYNQKPATPTTGTAPSKESAPATSTPSTTPSPSTSTTPTNEAAKASTLPFTGFDLRWSLGIGLMLVAGGFSIVLLQRRRRYDER